MKEKQFALASSLTGNDKKDIRKKLKLTQGELAELVNVSVKTVERWEGGRIRFPVR